MVEEVKINITPAEQAPEPEDAPPEVTPEPVKRPRGRAKSSKGKPKVVPVEPPAPEEPEEPEPVAEDDEDDIDSFFG